MVWLAMLCVLALCFYFYVKKQQSFWEKTGIKYVKPSFMVGNMSLLRRKCLAELSQGLYNYFPEERYHGIYLFLQPVLILKDPDLIKQVTVKEFDHFVDHNSFVDADSDPFWGKNLFSSEGEKWRNLRTTLSPSFTGSKMRMMYGLMEECAQGFVDYFKNQNSATIDLDVKDAISRYTNDVIASAAFGLKCNSLKDRQNDFYLMGIDATNFTLAANLKFFMYAVSPTLTQMLKMRIVSAKVADFFTQIIAETVKIRKEQNIVRPDMIQLMMKDHQFTLEEMTAQAFIFFFAGFETVSATLTFAFYELALHPDIQDRLREEIEALPGNITYEAVVSMKYLDMVLSETLRKWPGAVLTDRRTTKDFTIEPRKLGEKALVLKKGLVCWLPIFALHRDPRHFPEPDKFDPERFSEDNKHKINSSVYMPFGAGPRNCIGSRFALLESKLLLVYILKNFQVVPTQKTKIPIVLDPTKAGLIANEGMWLGLKKL